MSKITSNTTPKPHGGNAAVKINARNAVYAIAQGNMTTGRINMGDYTADSPSKNYNYTDPKNEAFNQPFTGLPDAMEVYIYANLSGKGKATALLQGNGKYYDPGDNNDGNVALIASATKSDIGKSTSWKPCSINFVYNDKVQKDTRPAYALITFSTNVTPGGGSSSDYMCIDDLKFIYNSELSSAIYDGEELEFDDDGGCVVDAEYDPDLLTLEKNARGGTIERSYDEETAILTITVKGDNISEDQNNFHTYTIQFNLPNYSSELEKAMYDGKRFRFYDGEATLRLTEPFNGEKLEVIPVSNSATTAYTYENGLLTITVKGGNFSSDPTNVHIYTANVIVKPAATVVGEPVSYEDDIVVTVNGSSTEPQLATIVKNNMSDGTTQFIIKNFKLGTMAVGNITLSDVTINADGSFSTTQEIQIEAGDDESVSSWMGPMITAGCDGSVPIVMSGKITDYALYVTIDIDLMDALEQIIYVQFGYDFKNYTLSSEYGTICIPTAAALPTGVKAYSCATVTNNVLDLTEVSSLAANTPYILQKTGSEASYTILTTEKSDAEVYTAGCLNGVLAEKKYAPVGSYVLQNLDGNIAFYQVSSTDPITVPANRCYLTTTANVKALAFPDGTLTSISEIQAADEKAVIYDLSGRRVSKATKGIYIINGKKVIK